MSKEPFSKTTPRQKKFGVSNGQFSRNDTPAKNQKSHHHSHFSKQNPSGKTNGYKLSHFPRKISQAKAKGCQFLIYENRHPCIGAFIVVKTINLFLGLYSAAFKASTMSIFPISLFEISITSRVNAIIRTEAIMKFDGII